MATTQKNTLAIAYRVGASEYGGPGDPTSGHKGYHGDTLDGKMAFAELGMGSTLGNLPYRTKLRISFSGKSVIAEKLDIGLGGAPVSGHARRIDLWYQTAQALGFKGTGLVDIQRLDGGPILGPNDVQTYQKGDTAEGSIPGTFAFPSEAKELGKSAEDAVDKAKKLAAAAKAPFDWGHELGKVLNFLGSSSGWVRIGKVVLGAGLLVIAVTELTKISPEASTAVDPIKKAAGVAKNVR